MHTILCLLVLLVAYTIAQCEAHLPRQMQCPSSGIIGFKPNDPEELKEDKCDGPFIVGSSIDTGTLCGDCAMFLTNISVWVDHASPDKDDRKYMLGVYDDTSSFPLFLQGNSSKGYLESDEWNTLPVDIFLCSEATYWLMMMSNEEDCGMFNNMAYRKVEGYQGAKAFDYFFGTFPFYFGPLGYHLQRQYAIYANYTCVEFGTKAIVQQYGKVEAKHGLQCSIP